MTQETFSGYNRSHEQCSLISAVYSINVLYAVAYDKLWQYWLNFQLLRDFTVAHCNRYSRRQKIKAKNIVLTLRFNNLRCFFCCWYNFLWILAELIWSGVIIFMRSFHSLYVSNYSCITLVYKNSSFSMFTYCACRHYLLNYLYHSLTSLTEESEGANGWIITVRRVPLWKWNLDTKNGRVKPLNYNVMEELWKYLAITMVRNKEVFRKRD